MDSLNLSTSNLEEEEVTSPTPTPPLLSSIITNTFGAEAEAPLPMEFVEAVLDLPPSTGASSETWGTGLSTNEWGVSTPSANGAWAQSTPTSSTPWEPSPSPCGSYESPAIATSGPWLPPTWCTNTTKKVAAKPQVSKLYFPKA